MNLLRTGLPVAALVVGMVAVGAFLILGGSFFFTPANTWAFPGTLAALLLLAVGAHLLLRLRAWLGSSTHAAARAGRQEVAVLTWFMVCLGGGLAVGGGMIILWGVPEWLAGIVIFGFLLVGLWMGARQSADLPFDNRCPNCGYDLRGTPGPRCSECGAVVPLEKHAPQDTEP